jgi:TonB family protein
MKTILAICLSMFVCRFSAQAGWFQYYGEQSLTVKEKTLHNSGFLTDAVPQFWNRLLLPGYEREDLNRRLEEDFEQGYYMTPPAGCTRFINYESVEITVVNGQTRLSASAPVAKLTQEQRASLRVAHPGSRVIVKVRFSYEDQQWMKSDGRIHEGRLELDVVPEQEAFFPGGNNGLSEYFSNKIPERYAFKVRQAIVRFQVDENGTVTGIKLHRGSGDPAVDKLLIRAFSEMPPWVPARDHAMRVSQDFEMTMGGGGC